MSDEGPMLDEQQIHQATKAVIDLLLKFDNETRRRVFRRALGFFELDVSATPSTARHSQNGRGQPPERQGPQNGSAPHFAERSELPPKDFMFQKQPRTDIERIACLAYYLSHYRDTPHFKTIDLSKLNTDAAQIKFSNTAFAVVNATNASLLVPAGKGRKQLSALGERYVDALPDRDAAKEVLASVRTRRGRKSSRTNSESE
jgi:hypothetical protein